MRFRTDKFEVVMLMMTALCCSVALVSCGKTAKSLDAEKHGQEVAAQLKAQTDAKAKTDQAQTQAQAAAAQKTRDDALKAQEDREKKMKIAAQAPPVVPGAVKPGAAVNPAPIGVPSKDGKDNKDKTTGTQTSQVPVPGAQGNPGPAGAPGAKGEPGKDGANGTLLGGGVPGAPTGSQPGTASGGGSSVVPPSTNTGHDSSALSSDFASEGLNLLDLGQAEATWSGCTVTVATLGQPAANQQATKERFIVEKSGAFHRTRQLSQGSDCATPIAAPEQLDGTLKIVSREAGSTADAITYKMDLHVPTFGAVPQPQPQPGQTTTTPAPQETVIQELIKIERQSGTLSFGKEPEAGQARPTTVDGGYKLKHN